MEQPSLETSPSGKNDFEEEDDGLPEMKNEETVNQKRIKRSMSLQSDLNGRVRLLERRSLPITSGSTKSKVQQNVLNPMTKLLDLQDTVPSYLAQRFTMNSVKKKRAVSLQVPISQEDRQHYLTKSVSLPRLVKDTESAKTKCRVHFACPLETNCSRYLSRRNALCDPEKMIISQDAREKIQSDVVRRKQSIARRFSNFFSVHLGLCVEEDLW